MTNFWNVGVYLLSAISGHPLCAATDRMNGCSTPDSGRSGISVCILRPAFSDTLIGF